MIFMIEPKYGKQLIPYMSPTGGGYSHEFKRNNPAWDYRYILRDLPVGQRIRIRSRLVYRPFVSNADVLKEYDTWAAALKRAPGKG